MKTIGIKKALQLYGATDIEIYNGYRYRSGFYMKDGQLYYFAKDVAVDGYKTFPCLTRTAANRKDYHGGTNQYVLESWLEDHGYKLEIKPCRCDYNRM